MVDLIRRKEWPKIGTAMEHRLGNYVAGVEDANWYTYDQIGIDNFRVQQEKVVVIGGDIYIDELKETGNKRHLRKRIFKIYEYISEDRKELGKSLERRAPEKGFEIQDWGEFFMLFDPILKYYRGVVEEYRKAKKKSQE